MCAFCSDLPKPLLSHLAYHSCLQQVEDDQKEIKNACFQYLCQFFKSMDEEGKGVLVGDAFKTAIGKLEEDVSVLHPPAVYFLL